MPFLHQACALPAADSLENHPLGLVTVQKLPKFAAAILFGPVVQWIEQVFPKYQIQVRSLAGLQDISTNYLTFNQLCSFLLCWVTLWVHANNSGKQKPIL
jgi:Na+/glutamate symporter